MLQKFQKHIDAKLPFLKGKKILIAISGGVDSVALTHLLQLLKFNITLAHCNFQLRDNESDLDQEFVKNLGNKIDVETCTIKFDTKQFSQENKLSTQLAARKLRYDWFNELIKKHHFDYVVTAHHADDNLETFLINLTRGTGLEGLTGIPQQNGHIIRPLLTFSRDEILKYAKANNIKWREDASNSETKYLRNKIRHDIVPKLKEMNPSLLSSFEKTSEYLKQSQHIIDDKVKEVSKEIMSKEFDTIKLDIQKINKLSNPKAYLYQILKNYGFTEWNNVFTLINSQSGKYIYSNKFRLLKNRDFLLLSPTHNNVKQSDHFLIEENISTVQKPIPLIVKKTSKISDSCKNSIFINKKLVFFPLILRRWSEGDFFFPSGMKGKKKISKYFKDEKYSLVDKENTWLLCSNNGDIIWIVGKRQDRRFLATNETENIIKISIKQIPN